MDGFTHSCQEWTQGNHPVPIQDSADITAKLIVDNDSVFSC